jgi:hypothetical protein
VDPSRVDTPPAPSARSHTHTHERDSLSPGLKSMQVQRVALSIVSTHPYTPTSMLEKASCWPAEGLALA